MGNLVSAKKMTVKLENVKSSIFDYQLHDLSGKAVNMTQYSGRVLLVVNTASKCGLAKGHYPELSSLKSTYESQGFDVLGFPCSQFAKQEHSNAVDIEAAASKFEINFPLMEKVDVNGASTHPIYQFLKTNVPTMSTRKGDSVTLENIGWNFGKFLIDRKGVPVKYYGPRTSPKDCKEDIELVLKGEGPLTPSVVDVVPEGGYNCTNADPNFEKTGDHPEKKKIDLTEEKTPDSKSS